MGNAFKLIGLPAENPLGFLAALGALLTARRAWPDPESREAVKLGWSSAMGGWRPVLHLPGELSDESFIAMLYGALHRTVSQEASQLAAAALNNQRTCNTELKAANKKLKALRRNTPERASFEAEELGAARRKQRDAVLAYRAALAAGGAPDPAVALGAHLKEVDGEQFLTTATAWADAALPRERRLADMASAFGSEAALDDQRQLEPTALSKANGSGNKFLLKDAGTLMMSITPARLAAALFAPWDYADAKLALGWDPAEAREHALAGAAADESKTMHGANLLAFEGLALVPAAPERRGLATTGTASIDGARCFTWPVWSAALDCDAVRSVVALRDLHERAPDRAALARRGIVEIYRAAHFTFAGKYPRFRPARSV